MFKKKLILFLYILTAFSLFADNQELVCSIRFYNKTIYYPGKSIPVEINIHNNASFPRTFDLADQRVFNMDFSVETFKKQRLPHTEKFIIARGGNQPVYIREITLEPGDRYSFITDLADYIEISHPGMYRITGMFHTELNNGFNKKTLTTNILTLSVRPGGVTAPYEDVIDMETTEVLIKQMLPPDEIVDYMLKARQEMAWTKFFLYLDLKELFLNNETRERRYRRSTEEEQLVMLQEFKQAMILGDTERGIIDIPYTYEVINTSYTPKEAVVMVNANFRHPDYMEKKKYTYYLHKRDGIWVIYNYEVMNLGNEKL